MKRPGRYWWVAPSYAQTKIAMELIKNLLPVGTYVEYRAEMRLVLVKPDGTEHAYIEFKSGDNPDSLRGFAVHFFVLDEAARMPEESWVSVQTTITQTGAPGIIISTPNGRGWFYDVYQWGEKCWPDGTPKFSDSDPDPHAEWFSIRMPTWTNPTVPLEFVIQAKKNLPKAMFQQEYAASFIQESSSCFANIEECCRGEFERPQRGHRYIIGVDLARLNDYTVLIVVDVTAHRNHVVYFDRFNDIKWQIQYRKIKALSEAYFNAIVVVDSTGIGDPIVETLSSAGVPVDPYKIGTSVAKQNLIENLRLCLEHGKVSYPKIGVLIEELRNYEYEHTPNGTIRYSAPRGKHDDAVISLALACIVADRPEWIYKHRQLRGI
jgi:phage FluMu gp28-like protein